MNVLNVNVPIRFEQINKYTMTSTVICLIKYLVPSK